MDIKTSLSLPRVWLVLVAIGSLLFFLSFSVLGLGRRGARYPSLTVDPVVQSGRGAMPTEELHVSVRFHFDISNMVTGHQFQGQINTFHVTYEYEGLLKGGGFDPKGHNVSPDTFPYFQEVREDMIKFIKHYPDRDDFYEVFGTHICEHVLQLYPQIREISLEVDIPAYAGVKLHRAETVVVARHSADAK